jgi:Protein kinase domain
MAIQKREIILSAIVVLAEVLDFILGSTKVTSYSLETTIYSTVIYFILCYLYINRISGTKWRILIAALSLGLFVVLICVHFYLHPRRWDFQTRVIYGIDIVAVEIFLLATFTQDWRSTILFTAFVAQVLLFFYNREDSENFNQIFTVVVSVIVYIILSTFHVKQIWDRKWKVTAVAAIFVFTMVIGTALRIYWYKKQMLFGLIASFNAFLSLVPWLWLMCAPKIKEWWRVYHEQEIIEEEEYNFHEMAGLPARFTIKELEIATSSFQAPIGEGASGAVFKGKLEDGSTIAVKRIKWQPNGETEFRTEMTIIASRQHVNLVRLLGFCKSPRGDRYLIYPFLENGSLDAWLFTGDMKRSQLTWALRYHIAIDVAKALAYLHDECHNRILHLDIKPANILLDRDFRALLSDFGISKLIGKDESSVMTRARGTVNILWSFYLFIINSSKLFSGNMVLSLSYLGNKRIKLN